MDEWLAEYRRDAEAFLAEALQDCQEAGGAHLAALQSGLADIAAEVGRAPFSGQWPISACMADKVLPPSVID